MLFKNTSARGVRCRMICKFDNCTSKAEIVLKSIDMVYCRFHFYEVAYSLLGPKRLEEKLGRQRVRKIQKLLGVQV